MQRSLRLRALTVLALALAVGAAQGRPVLIAPKPTVGATSQNTRARWERRPAEEFKARLNADTGVEWTVWMRDQEVHSLSPRSGPPTYLPGATPEQKARLFLDKYRMYLHGSGDPSELRVERSERDTVGRYFLRFAHYLPGTDIRVEDSYSTFEFLEDESLSSASSGIRAAARDVPRTPNVHVYGAVARAVLGIAKLCDAEIATVAPLHADLVAEPSEGKGLRLVWHITATTRGCVAPEAEVDAMNGDTLRVADHFIPCFPLQEPSRPR